MRQRQIRDEEVLRARENETKKTLEVELLMARNERDTLAKAQREAEVRLKDLEVQRIKLDKEHVEQIERYKADLQRQFQDQDFEHHRRRLQLEQDESRVKFERDRIATIENSNQKLTKELNDIKEDMSKMHSENTSLFKENRDMKDQIRILNENLRRETEQLLSRDRENTTLHSENQVLKTRLDEYRTDTNQLKEEQVHLIENL